MGNRAAAKQNRSQKIATATGCEFCRINDNSITKIIDLEHGSLHLNYNQSFKGRTLYVPHEHFTNLYDVSPDKFAALSIELQSATLILQEALKADLMNLALLCNKVRHIHWHIIPRYENDTNWGKAPWPNEPITFSETDLEKLKKELSSHFNTN